MFDDLSKDDKNHARFDDVRAAAMAIEEVRLGGIGAWIGSSLDSPMIDDVGPYHATVDRGLKELKKLLARAGVK